MFFPYLIYIYIHKDRQIWFTTPQKSHPAGQVEGLDQVASPRGHRGHRSWGDGRLCWSPARGCRRADVGFRGKPWESYGKMGYITLVYEI